MSEPYYRDDHVTLYHGDCRDLIAWVNADVLVTDPPYGMVFRSSWTTEKRPIEGDNDAAIRDCALGMWGTERPWLMFGTWRIPRPANTRHVLIWDKAGAGPGMGDLNAQFGTSHEEIYLGGAWPKRTTRRGSVIRSAGSPASLTAKIGHPTPKPEALMALLVGACEGTVADPFAGSGSTLVAAKMLGRKAIGVELEERYCEIAARRLAQDALPFGGAA